MDRTGEFRNLPNCGLGEFFLQEPVLLCILQKNILSIGTNTTNVDAWHIDADQISEA